MPVILARDAQPMSSPTQSSSQGSHLWRSQRLVDGAMSSPSYLALLLLGTIIVVCLCRRRMRNSIGRLVSQAIGAANVPSLHIHIHGHTHSTSNEYAAIPNSPESPVPPSQNLETGLIGRSLHIDIPPIRSSTVHITRISSPLTLTDTLPLPRSEVTAVTFYPDSLSSPSTSTPALSESDSLSPRSDVLPLTPRTSIEEEVKLPKLSSSATFPLPPLISEIHTSPSPDQSAFTSRPALKPSPQPVLTASHTAVEPIPRPPTPTTTVSLLTQLPSQSLFGSRSGSAVVVPPAIMVTEVPELPSLPQVPQSPHTLAVPDVRMMWKRKQAPPPPPPVYEASRYPADVWIKPVPVVAPRPTQKQVPVSRRMAKRPPPPPPQRIIPLDLEAIYPTEAPPALRRPPPPPKPIIPFELEAVYPSEKSFSDSDAGKLESGIDEKRPIRYGQYDEEETEAETPTSATMFFKALVEKGKKELKRERPVERKEEKRKPWGGIGAKMSAFAKRAVSAIERELDSDSENEEIRPKHPAPTWPNVGRGRDHQASRSIVVMPSSVMETRRESVFVIGDDEDE